MLRYILLLLLTTSTLTASAQRQTPILDSGIHVYYTPDVMPEPKYDMGRFIGKNLKYPADARDRNLDGVVFIRVVIANDGTVSRVRLAGSSGTPSLDAEALRVVRMLQPWSPGILNGEAVNVYKIIPVTFKLK